MDREIFRKKNLDKIKSPETLDDYIRVTNPGVWLLLVSVILLLAGACVWAIFGHVDSTVSTGIRVENGVAVCYLTEEDFVEVKTGMSVKFADCEALISSIGQRGEMGHLCTLELSEPVEDGFYEGRIITNRFQPLSFILN